MTQGAFKAREAVVMRLRLGMGLASLEDVERWADRWIVLLDDPPVELLDLSTSARAGGPETLSLLLQLNRAEPLAEDWVAAAASAAGRELSAQELERLVYQLARKAYQFLQGGTPADQLLTEVYQLEDNFHLARQKYGTFENACDEARDFLQRARAMSEIQA